MTIISCILFIYLFFLCSFVHTEYKLHFNVIVAQPFLMIFFFSCYPNRFVVLVFLIYMSLRLLLTYPISYAFPYPQQDYILEPFPLLIYLILQDLNPGHCPFQHTCNSTIFQLSYSSESGNTSQFTLEFKLLISSFLQIFQNSQYLPLHSSFSFNRIFKIAELKYPHLNICT